MFNQVFLFIGYFGFYVSDQITFLSLKKQSRIFMRLTKLHSRHLKSTRHTVFVKHVGIKPLNKQNHSFLSNQTLFLHPERSLKFFL